MNSDLKAEPGVSKCLNMSNSSNIIESIKVVCFFFLSRKDFTRTKSTKTHISEQKQKRQF